MLAAKRLQVRERYGTLGGAPRRAFLFRPLGSEKLPIHLVEPGACHLLSLVSLPRKYDVDNVIRDGVRVMERKRLTKGVDVGGAVFLAEFAVEIINCWWLVRGRMTGGASFGNRLLSGDSRRTRFALAKWNRAVFPCGRCR